MSKQLVHICVWSFKPYTHMHLWTMGKHMNNFDDMPSILHGQPYLFPCYIYVNNPEMFLIETSKLNWQTCTCVLQICKWILLWQYPKYSSSFIINVASFAIFWFVKCFWGFHDKFSFLCIVLVHNTIFVFFYDKFSSQCHPLFPTASFCFFSKINASFCFFLWSITFVS